MYKQLIPCLMTTWQVSSWTAGDTETSFLRGDHKTHEVCEQFCSAEKNLFATNMTSTAAEPRLIVSQLWVTKLSWMYWMFKQNNDDSCRFPNVSIFSRSVLSSSRRCICNSTSTWGWKCFSFWSWNLACVLVKWFNVGRCRQEWSELYYQTHTWLSLSRWSLQSHLMTHAGEHDPHVVGFRTQFRTDTLTPSGFNVLIKQIINRQEIHENRGGIPQADKNTTGIMTPWVISPLWV